MSGTSSCRSLAFALLALSGCATTLRAGRPDPVPDESFQVSESASDRCMHGVPGPSSPYREPLPGAEEDARRVFLDALDPTVRRTAVAAGLEPLLARVLEARANGTDARDPALLSMRLELAQRIASLETQRRRGSRPALSDLRVPHAVDALGRWRPLAARTTGGDVDGRARGLGVRGPPFASDIVFRDGGVYDPSLLGVHQAMLQELGAELDAMARDIDLLSRAVALALEMDFDTTDDD